MKLIFQQNHPLQKSVVQYVYLIKNKIGVSVLKYVIEGKPETYDIALIRFNQNDFEFIEPEDRCNLNEEQFRETLENLKSL